MLAFAVPAAVEQQVGVVVVLEEYFGDGLAVFTAGSTHLIVEHVTFD